MASVEPFGIRQPYDIGLYIDLFINKINKVKTTKCAFDFIMVIDNIDNHFCQDETKNKRIDECTGTLRHLFCTYFGDPLKQKQHIPIFEELDDDIAKKMIDCIVYLCMDEKIRTFLNSVYKL